MSYTLVCDLCGKPVDRADPNGYYQVSATLVVPTNVDPEAPGGPTVAPRPVPGPATTAETHPECLKPFLQQVTRPAPADPPADPPASKG